MSGRSVLPSVPSEAWVEDKLVRLMRLVVTANSTQKKWMYSLEYTIGKYVHVTRRPWVIESAYTPVDVTGKDVRADDPDALEKALNAVMKDIESILQEEN